MEPRPVTLLTDLGVRDEFAGVLEGVIAEIAPAARVIHVTHGVEREALVPGAIAFANAIRFLPVGVHLAIVERGAAARRLVLETADRRLLVGPDNGLLLPAADVVGGVAAAYEIANDDLTLHPVSATFAHRDVYAPVAAHLARGVDVATVGARLELRDLERLEIPAARIAPGRVEAVALAIDHFGNVALNARARDLETAGLLHDGRLELQIGEGRFYALRAQSFTHVPHGEMVAFDDSSGWISIAVRGGSIVEVTGVRRGVAVLLVSVDG